MNNKEVIQFLWDTGHFNNPDFPTSIEDSDLSILTLSDKPVQQAIMSYQDFFRPEYEALTLSMHGTLSVIDGQLSPATTALLEMPRCGAPDFQPMSSGSWPKSCHPEYPGIHSFALYFDKSGMPGFLQTVFDAAWLLCRQAYADIGIAFFEVDSPQKANTVVTWQGSRSWIGLAIVPNSPRCNERIWAKFANSYNPRDLLNQWARLLAHEFCHNMGLSHTRGGIMNPSIVSGPFTPTAWRGDPTESSLTRFFGGVPVDLGISPKPPPPPLPPENDYWFRGDFELMHGDESLGKYILTPKPQV